MKAAVKGTMGEVIEVVATALRQGQIETACDAIEKLLWADYHFAVVEDGDMVIRVGELRKLKRDLNGLVIGLYRRLRPPEP